MSAMSWFFVLDKKKMFVDICGADIGILLMGTWGAKLLRLFLDMFKFCPYYASSTMVEKYQLLGN